ncbi:HYR domain-containing protein [Aureitalea sp. L0-47]|uniref:HYR domain-containing protein n=1 Tax=Aureitalea sp. L0-47 TaxID=2816962 RepID=UPI0022375DEB|nr:HYR domain-containing protein [Aureitalea sp. L0-47]MCW5518353.1 HYR domain-containing protein [Aureitalea sp. L0-47]
MKIFPLLGVFLFSISLTQLHAQDYLDLIHNPTETTTLSEIQQLAESYFEDRDRGRGSGYKQYKRWEYHTQRKVNSDGRILNFSKLTQDAISSLESENPPVGRMPGNWTSMGPMSYTNGNSGYNGGLGRVNVIAFHPTDANTIYLGVPAGGLWKTTDGGSSWSPMSDQLASIGVSGIAVDHNNPNTVYILTGDGDGADTYSIGVMKSTDGGATWNTTGLTWGVTNFVRGYKLLMHPTNSNIMMAVTTSGIYRTTDGWATATNVQSGSFRDIEFKPGDPTTVYAVTTNTFYKSTDTGASWGTAGTGLPSGENRIALAVTPANANYVYYLAGPGGASGSGTFRGLYRSTDSGTSFSNRSTTPNILGSDVGGGGTGDQSWYDLAIAVNPTNADNTITGGVNVWRSTNGGSSHTLSAYWYFPGASQYVHADIHELVYNPLNNRLYCGSDGGISYSTDHGVTWTNIWDGLEIMQFYKISGVEANQNLIIGGTQDNGTNKYTGSTNIEHILGGDGMDNMIDYTNNNTIYYSFQNGGLRRSTNGGSSSTSIQPGGSTGAWVTPYAMDSSNPNIIYGGYSDVYRSTNQGSTWTNLGADGRGALAVGINDGSRLYAARNNVLRTSSNTGGSWSTVTGPWPSGLTITDIAIDPANASRVWITLSGYTAGQKVYESTNAGASWTNISGTLPNVPALSIAYENTGGAPADAIYIGMAVGVYYTSDSTPWTLYNTGLPNVPIYDLEINHTNSKLRAGTYGRGLWETPLYNVVVCDILTSTVTTTAPSCPGGNDGSLSVTATCSTCTGIQYTITPTNPAGPPIVQVNNGAFTNLAANSYTVYIEDTGDSSCNENWGSNPEVVPDGTDSIAPAISCPSDVNVECGNDTSPTATGTATASDNCDPNPGVTFSDSSAAGCGNTEVITRTWTATDASGNSIDCTQTITVVDTTMPTVSCTADITVDNDPGLCEAVVNYSLPTASDSCGGITITQTAGFSSGSLFPVGTTTNVFVITDDCGNAVGCSFDVTVEDNEAPVLTCPADQTVNVGPGNQYTVPDYFANGLITANDNCTSPVSSTSQNPAPGTLLSGGTYTISATATDAEGNTGNCSFQLIVDTTLGTVDNSGLRSVVIYLNPAKEYVILGNPGNIDLDKLEIYTLQGRLVQTLNLVNMGTEKQIEVSEFAAGTYLFRIYSENESITKFVVKE